MKRLLDLYIIKKFISITLIVLISFVVIFVSVNAIDNIDKFIENKIPNTEILKYYLFSIPYFLSYSLPISLLIATVFTFASLQKNHETTAIKASGISIRRISLPLIILGAVLSVTLFFFDNIIVTKCLDNRIDINNKNQKTNIINNITILDDENKILYEIKKYFIKNKRGMGFKKLALDGNYDIKNRIDIANISWNDNNRKWLAQDYKSYSFKNKKINKNTIEKLDKISIEFVIGKNEKITPEFIVDIEKNKKNKNKPILEMSYWELQKEIANRKKYGYPYREYEVSKHYKTSFACIPFIMILFGVSLSIQKPRNNFVRGIGLSLLTIFLYYISIQTGYTFANDMTNPTNPFISMWIVNFIFLAIGVILFFRTRT